MNRRKLQLALLSRGIRVSDDDPMFLILELNEIHFEELVISHLNAIDQHLIQKIVSQTREIDKSTHHIPSDFRCLGGTSFEKSANRLESVASTFAQLEDKMFGIAQDAARKTAREFTGQLLNKLVMELESGVRQFNSAKAEATAIFASTSDSISASRKVCEAVRRVEAWWFGFACLLAATLMVGMYLGHMTTTKAYERVQAACTAAAAEKTGQ